MKLIKIIRETIRRNPDAGEGEIMVHGTKKIVFKVIGEIPPERLFDNRIAIISMGPVFTKGVLLNEVALKLLDGLPYEIERGTNQHVLEHVIENEFLYERENPPLECLKCHQYTRYDDISLEFDDMLMPLQICPNCKTEYSFEDCKEEQLEDVLKEIGLK